MASLCVTSIDDVGRGFPGGLDAKMFITYCDDRYCTDLM